MSRRRRVRKIDAVSHCTSKVRFDDEKEARDAFKGNRPRPGGNWEAYRCKLCGGWHVSSGTKR